MKGIVTLYRLVNRDGTVAVYAFAGKAANSGIRLYPAGSTPAQKRRFS